VPAEVPRQRVEEARRRLGQGCGVDEHARHRHLARQAELALLPVVDLRVRPDQPVDLSALADWQGSQQVPAVCAVGAAEAKLELDRKSTRLNSSHRTISYAVFCLKKK